MREAELIRIIDAQLRYYMHIESPEALTDEEWAMRIKELEWIRKAEAGPKGR
ncbi:MAG: hypothetical protein MJZ81_06500 [Bacteroidales bacterium]|nr:hypothetical protein [Bacteroidales bacterium]